MNISLEVNRRIILLGINILEEESMVILHNIVDGVGNHIDQVYLV